jgi:dTMP kinase
MRLKIVSLFITFEGGEGSGKSVQAKALFRRLSQLAVPVLLTHEPGGTSFGNKVGHWLKWAQDANLSSLTELMLFNASRAQLIAEVIQPNLKSGKVVISDRYADSTTVYQGYGRGLDLVMVKAINNAATEGLQPILTILLDIPVEEGLARKGKRKPDRFEREALAFHQRIKEGYLKLAAGEPKRWLVIDGIQPRRKIAETIWRRVNQLLQNRGN